MVIDKAPSSANIEHPTWHGNAIRHSCGTLDQQRFVVLPASTFTGVANAWPQLSHLIGSRQTNCDTVPTSHLLKIVGNYMNVLYNLWPKGLPVILRSCASCSTFQFLAEGFRKSSQDWVGEPCSRKTAYVVLKIGHHLMWARFFRADSRHIKAVALLFVLKCAESKGSNPFLALG